MSRKNRSLINRLGLNPIEENVPYALAALCGLPKHCATSEAFFAETAYDFKNGLLIGDSMKETPIIINEKGRSINIFPIAEESSKRNIKTWECNEYCKTVDPDILKELKLLFDDLLYFTYTDAYQYLRVIDDCSLRTPQSHKIGHPITCYNEPLLCSSKFLKLVVLSYHYPYLRTIKRKIYKIKNLYTHIRKIDNALNSANVDELRNILLTARNLAMPLRRDNIEISLDEKELKAKYYTGIKQYTKIDMDPPKVPCISCERLHCLRSMEAVNNYSSNIDLAKQLLDITVEIYDPWKKLKEYYQTDEFASDTYICRTCFGKLKKNRCHLLVF